MPVVWNRMIVEMAEMGGSTYFLLCWRHTLIRYGELLDTESRKGKDIKDAAGCLLCAIGQRCWTLRREPWGSTGTWGRNEPWLTMSRCACGKGDVGCWLGKGPGLKR